MLTTRARLFFVVLFLEEVVVFVFEVVIFEVLILHQVFFVLGVFFVRDLHFFLVIRGGPAARLWRDDDPVQRD